MKDRTSFTVRTYEEVQDMKKKNVLELIRYHMEHDEEGFREAALEIARDFEENGDTELAEYVITVVTGANAWVPQSDAMPE